MSFKVYTEKHIRSKILSKIKPEIQKRNSPHDIGLVVLDNKLITKVKIPNGHNSDFDKNKAKKLAKMMCVDSKMYNGIMDCPIKNRQYYEHIRKTQL